MVCPEQKHTATCTRLRCSVSKLNTPIWPVPVATSDVCVLCGYTLIKGPGVLAAGWLRITPERYTTPTVTWPIVDGSEYYKNWIYLRIYHSISYRLQNEKQIGSKSIVTAYTGFVNLMLICAIGQSDTTITVSEVLWRYSDFPCWWRHS